MSPRSQAEQLSFFEEADQAAKPLLTDTSSTFQDNLALPIHRWFRYSAGFSAAWVRQVIEQEKVRGCKQVLDPFAGSGTVPLEAELAAVRGLGVEAHPFVARIARAKLEWRSPVSDFKEFALRVLEHASVHRVEEGKYPKLMEQCFPRGTLLRLYSLRTALSELADSSPAAELSWLMLVSILRQCSPVGTAQWQYVLPSKKKVKVVDPFRAFEEKMLQMAQDMTVRQSLPGGPKAKIFHEDARKCSSVPFGWAQLVITSPPYANNFDYADATRLEMTFIGEINSWGDLQNSVRKYLVRSCSQHVAPISGQTKEIIEDPVLLPIRSELADVCARLEEEREHHGGKKTYHTMVAAYFSDMARVWTALRRVTAGGGRVCFVVGDSAPYGIYVPVDRWFGDLALAAGFRTYRFEKTRDRNVKWKNRKHRVPLHEGRLWVEG
ncbi:MAG: DNA modification methylase [Acidobacteria bacterium RIFCSPLOWO2_12_FULL_60_22]|nr:MAG: DNA modification methylase [Acidobacteria bacterium RIFCSPLOWO2_12_FULL_60_22]